MQRKSFKYCFRKTVTAGKSHILLEQVEKLKKNNQAATTKQSLNTYKQQQ